MKDKGIKVESDDGSNFEDSDEEEATVENGIPKDLPEGEAVVLFLKPFLTIIFIDVFEASGSVKST